MANGAFDKAILNYKKAWEHAQQAIKFAEKGETKAEEKVHIAKVWGRFLERVGGAHTQR